MVISPDYFRNLRFDESQFLLSQFTKRTAKSQFISWYQHQAKIILAERLQYWSEQMNTRYLSMRITGAKTRWGSCSRKRSINFSWKLIMAPIEVVDYVVVHELAHITHHNHSKNFWAVVNQTYPKWRESRQWLNANSGKLAL
jgi:predicted metal-dependent hydrolase